MQNLDMRNLGMWNLDMPNLDMRDIDMRIPEMRNFVSVAPWTAVTTIPSCRWRRRRWTPPEAAPALVQGTTAPPPCTSRSGRRRTTRARRPCRGPTHCPGSSSTIVTPKPGKPWGRTTSSPPPIPVTVSCFIQQNLGYTSNSGLIWTWNWEGRTSESNLPYNAM